MRLLAVVLFMLTPAAPLWADSDGYYCHAPGFIAWETRSGPALTHHILHVVRFSAAKGIDSTQRIILPDFQVHGMVCDASSVQLIGWDTRYRVDIRDPGRAVVTSEKAAFDGSKQPLPGNLGYAGRAGVIDLEADGRMGVFELVVSRTSRRINGGIDHHVVARLVQRDGSHPVDPVATRLLMEGVYRETIDDD